LPEGGFSIDIPGSIIFLVCRIFAGNQFAVVHFERSAAAAKGSAAKN
jgi:hypothetical protein